MVKIQIKGVTYRVRWCYFYAKKKKERTSVTCIFADENKVDVADGTSYLHKGDRFDKEVGRIISMNNCMVKMFGDSYEAKLLRRDAMKQYHNRPRNHGTPNRVTTTNTAGA